MYLKATDLTIIKAGNTWEDYECPYCKETFTLDMEDIDFKHKCPAKRKLPDLVQVCPICHGRGEYRQTYNAGCGQGFYKSMGPCDYCKHPEGHLNNGLKGLGYIMKGTSYSDPHTVPLSVINQIEVMNKDEEED